MENNIQQIIAEMINELGNGLGNELGNELGENTMNSNPIVQFMIPPFININDELLNRSFHEQGNTMKPLCSKFLEGLEETTIDNNDDNNTCSICLEELKEGDIVIKLPCNGKPHHFHSNKTEECDGIIPWLKGNNTCPVCRCEFPEEKNLINDSPPEIPSTNTEPNLTTPGQDDNNADGVNYQLRPINIMNQIMRRVIEEERMMMMNEEEGIQHAIMNSIDEK
jgi:hypothetical protein